MSFDLAASLRRRKPQRQTTPLVRRDDDILSFAPLMPQVGPELLLDTTVYIDIAQARAPSHVKRLLNLRGLYHSTIVLSELTHLFGRLDPANATTRATLAQVRSIIEAIPAHRLSTPTARAFAEAGMLAGLAARLIGGAHTSVLLNDASILLQAAENGWVVLTRNVTDFDMLQQLTPDARVMMYRRE